MASRQLSIAALERGRELWEQSRRSCDVAGFEDVRRWAAANPCAESERLLAKLCIQIAVNRLLSWVKGSLPQVLHSSAEDRAQAQITLDQEAATLFNTALEAAVRGACTHQSLQCFYLACLIAFWVRGRANPMLIMFRTPLLAQLDELWRRWDAARRSGTRPWADPAEERVIGERAPFEAEGKYVSQWLPKALALAPKKLEEAIADDRMVLEHFQTFLRPLEPRSNDPREMIHEPTAMLPMRLSQMNELVPSEERQRYAALLAQGDMKLRNAGMSAPAGGGRIVSGAKEQQHRLGQALKLQTVQERLRDAAQRRQLEQQQRQEAEAAAAAGRGAAGSSSNAGTSVVAAAGPADRPLLDDVRRFLERRLEQSSSAAASSSAAPAGGKKGRSKRPGVSAVQQAGEALQQLTRVAPAQLAAAAAEFEQQGALPPDVAQRVQALGKRLAGAAASGGGAPQLSYRWPPPPPLAAAATARGGARAGKGSAGQYAQLGRQAVQFEAANPAALSSFLEGKYLAAESPGMPQLRQALCHHLPGLQPLLEAMPATKSRSQQMLRGAGISEPPLKVPAFGEIGLESGLAGDTAFVKAVLRGGQPSPRTLLEVVRGCAPAVTPQDEPLLADIDALASSSGEAGSGGKAHGEPAAADPLFFSDEDQHLKAHFTPLDYHAFKSNELWMPVAEGAIGTRRFFGHCSDASFPLRVTQQGRKAHPGEVHAEATMSRMLLGEAMLAALQRRRQGGAPDGWREESVSQLLQRDLLPPPDHLLTVLEPDAELASILKSVAADAICATTEGDGGAVGAAGTGLSSSGAALAVGTGQPPVVQVAAAALLSARLVQAPGGPRIKLDWVQEEKARLLDLVLLGLQQLAGRGRLTRLAASSVSGFVTRALEDANAAAYPADTASLAECLRCLGGLPLVALAQLAAYVFQLVGRCFLGLPDLDPEAFKDLAGGDDLDAELLPGGDVQLSTRGLADLLGVPSALLNSSGGGSNGSAVVAAGSGSSTHGPTREAGGSGGGSGGSTALALAHQGGGAASSELALLPAGGGGDAAAVGTQLLQRGSQCLAAYAASGGAEGAAVAAHERPSLVLRRQKRQDGPTAAELLSALQQQTVLTGILLDLKAWIHDSATEQVPLAEEVQAFNQELSGTPHSLAAVDPAHTEQLVKRFTESMRPCMQALALAGHAWASLQLARQEEMIKQAQEGDDKLGRQLRGADGPTLILVESARAQLRVHSRLQKGTAAELERRLEDTARLAANRGAAFVSQQMDVYAAKVLHFLEAQRELQAMGTPPEVLAEAAKDAALSLLLLSKRGFDALRDVAGMVSQLDGLLDCCHTRTQLLLSELHSRCCVQPASELMGLALREVLPLAWQQEWRREQDSSSERFIAELLAEEEAAAKQKEKKQAKAAKKKKKGGSGAPSEQPSAVSAATSEAGGGSDDEGAPESWEELPSSTAEAAAAEDGGSGPPESYLRMLQQWEEEEQREAARQAQQAQQAQQQAQQAQRQAPQGGGAAEEDGEPGSGGKKGRKKSKKKKKSGKGEQQGDASLSGALEEGAEKEDSPDWQAVGKKGKQQQQQQGQQQPQQPPLTPPPGLAPPGLQRAPGPAPLPSGKGGAQRAQASPDAAQVSQERQPTQGRGQQQREQQQGQPFHQQAAHLPQQPQPQQLPRHQPRQEAHQQPLLPQLQPQQSPRHRPRQEAPQQPMPQQPQQPFQQHSPPQRRGQHPHERELRPHAQAFAPLPLPRALQPSPQQAQQVQQEAAQSPTAGRRLSSDFGRRRSLSADAPSFVPGQSSGLAPSGRSSALPQLPDSLEPSPAASPPPPSVPATPEPPAVAAATDDTSDLFALLGLGTTAPSPERPGVFGLEQQQEAPQVQPQMPQLAASQSLGLEPLGLGLGGMHHGLQHSSSAAALGPGASLFSQPFGAPLAHAAEPLSGPAGLAVSAGFGASMLQQPLGLGAAPAPAVDLETLAAAARAAAVAGYARQPDPLQPHATLLHGQGAAALPGASAALFLQQPQHAPAAAAAAVQHPAAGLQGPGGWGQAVQPLASSPGEDDMDSMLLSLGVTSSGDAAAAAWGAPGTSSADGSLLHAQPQQQPSGFPPLMDQPFGPAAQQQHAAMQQPPQHAVMQQQLPAVGVAAGPEAGGELTFTGLQNEAGEYNCFLNVVVQCLWRCTDFRQLVLSWSPAMTAHNPVARALHSLFLALAASAAQQQGAAGAAGSPVPVNPSELREALAALPNKLFQLGEMSDAGETLLTTFEKVREAHPAAATELDRVFGLQVREAVVCADPRCGKTTHQHAYTQYFYNTRAAALRRVVAQAAEERRLGRLGPKTLGARLRKVEEQVYKTCDTDHGGCNKSYAVTTRLEEAPRVFSLQIAWDSNQASPSEIAETLAAVDETVGLQEVYPDSPAGARRYALRSMVCYYGQHYQALVLVPEAGGWLMFDDTRVTRVGTWADVRRKCEAGRIQPSVLFYEAAA